MKNRVGGTSRLLNEEFLKIESCKLIIEPGGV